MATKNPIDVAVACLRFSAVLYALIALAFGAWLFYGHPPSRFGVAFMLTACLALVPAVEVVVWGLRSRRLWALRIGRWIFHVYFFSLFFPLGALGSAALENEGLEREFQQDKQGDES
ncbi:MAG: hypothetical protein AAGI54_14965 [Planctomycetota bacterium]